MNRFAKMILVLGLTLTIGWGLPFSGICDEKAPVKIGVIRDLSGNHADGGTSERVAVMLAFDEANDGGGINGHPIKYTIVDDQGVPDKAARIATRFITRDKVVAISGGTTSGSCLAICGVAVPRKIPVIGSGYSMKLHQDVRNADKTGHWYFAEGSNVDGLLNSTLAMLKQDKKTRVSFIYSTHVFTKGCLAAAKQKADNFGYKILTEIPIEGGATDATSQVNKAKESKPDALVVAVFYKEMGAIVRTLRTIGWDVPVYCVGGVSTQSLIDMMGPDMSEGLTAVTIADVQDKKVRAILKRAEKRYGRKVEGEGYFIKAYDATRALVEALKKCKNPLDSVELREALETKVGHLSVHGMKQGAKVGYSPLKHVLYERHMAGTVNNGKVVIR